MNESMRETLIDENEIRAALKPSRPDAIAFSDGVRRRVEAVASKTSNRPQSDWLRIAASFAPIHLLSRHIDTNITPISFAAISLGKKLVIVLAFPLLCFLMIGLTVIGMLRIRAAQSGQGVADFDIEQAHRATRCWWKSYGWIAALVFVTTLVAPFFGWTTPLMIALVCSGFAAVSFVRSLAKENLVERSVIGGACCATLGLLAQLSYTFSRNSSQLLDPNLVTGVLLAGADMISSSNRPLQWTKLGDLQALRKFNRECLLLALAFNVFALLCFAYLLTSIIPLLAIVIDVAFVAISFVSLRVPTSNVPRIAIRLMFLIPIMGFCTQSYWHGVTASDIRKHVELFDSRQLGSWDDWADAAKWLNDTGEGFDTQIARKHFQQDMEKEPQMRDFMLMAAVRSGLIPESEILSYADVQNDRLRLTELQWIDQPILFLKSYYFRIAAYAASKNLTASERDVLIKRLLVNWSQLESIDFNYERLRSALLLTELFNRLDPFAQLEQRTADVHRWLVKDQVTKPFPFHDGGGFLVSENAPDSNRRATLDAISLMETYGAPAELNLRLLRSYLRPNSLFDFIAYDYVPKTVARERLNHLAGVPKPTVIDYLQTDLSLWLSILLVLLFAYATFSSPVRPAPSITGKPAI